MGGKKEMKKEIRKQMNDYDKGKIKCRIKTRLSSKLYMFKFRGYQSPWFAPCIRAWSQSIP